MMRESKQNKVFSNQKRYILIIVENDREADQITEYLQLGSNADHAVLKATHPTSGFDMLKKYAHTIDAILLEYPFSFNSSKALLETMQCTEEYAMIPVVQLLASEDFELLKEGSALGAHRSLVKPIKLENCNSVIRSAIDFRLKNAAFFEEVEKIISFFRYVDTVSFKIQNLEDIKQITVRLASFFPHPKKVVLGIEEILLNAIEHGNLGITYEEKNELNLHATWKNEVNRRLQLPENKRKWVRITIQKVPTMIQMIVKDEGHGFDFNRYLMFDPRRAKDSNGRGIAIAKQMGFDTIQYIGSGNEVVCTMHI